MPSSSSLAPMIRLARPIRRAESQRMGGKRMSVLTIGALEQRRPVGVLHRPVLRHGLEEDEDHHDFEHDAEQHAEAAEEVLGDDADQGGGDQLADQHQQQDGVEEVGRVLDQPGQLPGAALLLVDQRLGLDPVHPHEAGLGHGQHARAGQQDRDDDDEDGVLGMEPRCRQQGEHAQAPRLTR